MSSVSRSIKMRLLAFLGAVLLLSACGGFWYFNYYTKTPEYALKMVQQSIEKHDKDKFAQYVDGGHLVDAASDALLDGLVAATVPTNMAGREAMANITKMFKAPVVIGLNAAINNYIEYGSWESPADVNIDEYVAVDLDMVLNKAGLKGTSFQNIDSISVAEDSGIAVANIRVSNEQCDDEFVLFVELQKREDGSWKVYEITNFDDFVAFANTARQRQMQEYMNQSAELIAEHNKKTSDIEKKMADTIAASSLNNNDTRNAVKNIVANEFAGEWKSFKDTLTAMEIPDAAATLHKLRIKICDSKLQYASSYAKWLEDKKAATLRESDNAMKRARTLEKEAENLSRQVVASLQ